MVLTKILNKNPLIVGTNEVGEAPQSPRAEEAALPIHRAEPVDVEGDLDLILAGSIQLSHPPSWTVCF